MKLVYTLQFKKNFRNFPRQTQKKFGKQAKYLITDLRHPSLHAKKYDEKRHIWQARVDRDIRFYFIIESESYILLAIQHHPK